MKKRFDVNDYLVDEEDFLPKPTIPVCIPRKAFRIEENSARHGYLLCIDKQWHLVHPDIAASSELSGIQKATLYKGIFEDGSLFLLPVTHPEPYNNSSWFDAWLEIVDKAQDHWLKVAKNDKNRRYDAKVVNVAEPFSLDELDMEQCLELAFLKKHIADDKHPVMVEAHQKYARADGFDD